MDAVPNNPHSTEQFLLPPLSTQKPVSGDRSLRIVLGRKTISLEQLNSFTTGQVVSLQEAAHEPVDVIRGGQVIAKAIPIQQGGELAWQVTEVMDRITDHQEVIS
jgi:flagellar motor switch/type III secretory pathway protein FliN